MTSPVWPPGDRAGAAGRRGSAPRRLQAPRPGGTGSSGELGVDRRLAAVGRDPSQRGPSAHLATGDTSGSTAGCTWCQS